MGERVSVASATPSERNFKMAAGEFCRSNATAITCMHLDVCHCRIPRLISSLSFETHNEL